MIIIAGPCVIESRENVIRIAKELEKLSQNKNIDFYFKASFDKANRTSLNSFRGLGMDEGLKILSEVKEKFGYKIVTDVHETYQVSPVAKVVDVIQIPAFLCRQTDLLVKSAQSGVKINIKKGQFLSAEAMQFPVKKVLQTKGITDINYKISNANNVWLCERGNVFGYGALVVDMKNLIKLREFAPVIFDATHSVQSPSNGEKTGGDSAFVAPLAKAATAVGVDGFFFETHFDPSVALSDGPNMITIPQLYGLIDDILKIKSSL